MPLIAPDATRAIRAATDLGAKANIPIIALTGYAMRGDKEKFLAGGVDDYIAKPFLMKELKQAIARVMQPKNAE